MRALAAGAPLARMRRRAVRARTAECSVAASTDVSAELGTAIELESAADCARASAARCFFSTSGLLFPARLPGSK